MSTQTKSPDNQAEEMLLEAMSYSRSNPQLSLEKLDHLEANHDLSNQPENQCKALMLRAFLLGSLRPDHTRETYLLQALEIAERHKLESRRGSLLGALGDLAMMHGKYDLAKTRTQMALDVALKLDEPRNIGRAANTLSIIHTFTEEYEAAINFGFQAQEALKKTDDTSSLATSYNCIGMVYSSLDEFDTATTFYKRAFELSVSINDYKSSFENSMNLAGLCVEKADYYTAIGYLEQAEEFARKGRPDSLWDVYTYSAFVYSMMGNQRQARLYLNKADSRAEEPTLNEGYYMSTVFKAATLTYLDEAEEARLILAKVLQLPGIDMSSDQSQMAHGFMADALNALGREHEARYYQDISDRMLEESRNLKVIREVYAISRRRERLMQGDKTLNTSTSTDTPKPASVLQDTLNSHVRSAEVLASIKMEINKTLPKLGENASNIAKSTLNKIDDGLANLRHSPLPENYLEESFPDIIKRLKQHTEHLTSTEIRTCVLLNQKFRSKDIARMLACSNETVKTHRKNVRKKLGLPKGVNLTSFLVAL